MHDSSMDLMKSLMDRFVPERAWILDLGSRDVQGQGEVYRKVVPEGCEYVGADLEAGDNVDIVLEEVYDWGIVEKYDVIISGQTFEHIAWPWKTMVEIEKALREDGYAILINPFKQGEHRYPEDCWRILPDGWQALADWAGLELVESQLIDNEYGDCYGVFYKPRGV